VSPQAISVLRFFKRIVAVRIVPPERSWTAGKGRPQEALKVSRSLVELFHQAMEVHFQTWGCMLAV